MLKRLRSLSLASCAALFALPLASFAQSGFALRFDGADDYVQVPDDPSLDLTTGLTIAAWIFLDSYTEWASFVTKGGIVDDGGALTPNNYTVHQSGPSAASGEYGHLRFTSFGLAGDSHSTIPLHEWHHVAVTFDGSFVRFYLDGQPDGVFPFFGTLSPNDDPLHIGVDFPGGDEYWHGAIDDLIILNFPLNQLALRSVAQRKFPLPSAVAGFWRFNEGSGDVAHDRSRYRNHGQLINQPTWINPGALLSSANAKASAGESSLPQAITLLSNYPNPFNPETEIRFALPHASHASVKIFNLLGEEIRALMEGEYEAGYHRAHWDGKDNEGRPVASGVYLYQLRVENFSQVKKMNLLR